MSSAEPIVKLMKDNYNSELTRINRAAKRDSTLP